MTMITDITPEHLRCSYGGCSSVHRCTFGASCPSVISDGKGGLVVIGKIAAGLATQMTRADGRLLSETIAADETAVLIGEEYFSDLPELTRLREENERLREALEQIKVGADNQGPFTGMSWLQVREICDRAFDGCQADVSAVGTRSSPSRSSDTATAEERDVSLTPQGPQDNG